MRGEEHPCPLYWLAMCVLNAATLVIAVTTPHGFLGRLFVLGLFANLVLCAYLVRREERKLRAKEEHARRAVNPNGFTVHGSAPEVWIRNGVVRPATDAGAFFTGRPDPS